MYLSMFYIPSSQTMLTHWNWMHPLMILMPFVFLYLRISNAQLMVFCIALNRVFLPEFNLINYDALLFPVLLVGRMLASKYIHYFCSHPAAFGHQTVTLLDNIVLYGTIRILMKVRFLDWHQCNYLCYFADGAGHFLYENSDCEYFYYIAWFQLRLGCYSFRRVSLTKIPETLGKGLSK